MSKPCNSTISPRALGDAFTKVLLFSGEKDFTDTVVLGARLADALKERGLRVAHLDEIPPLPVLEGFDPEATERVPVCDQLARRQAE